MKEITFPASLEELEEDTFYFFKCSVTFEAGSRLRKVSPKTFNGFETVKNLPKECGYYWDEEARSLQRLEGE